MNHQKDKMHPEDLRNMIIFAVLSLTLWFSYNSFIAKPKAEALKKAQIERAAIIEKNPTLAKPVKQVTREEALEATKRISFKNEAVFGTISLTGAMIDDLSLEQYYETLERKKHVTLFAPPQTKGARYVDYGWRSADKSIILPTPDTVWQVKDNDILTPDLPVSLIWDNGQGIRFEREISLDTEYVFTIKQKVHNQSGKDISLHPYALISQTDIPKDYLNTWVAHEGPMGVIGGKLEQFDYAAMTKEPDIKRDAPRGWIGVSDKYWLTALIPTQDTQSKYRFVYTPDPLSKDRTTYQTDFISSEIKITNGSTAEQSYNLYAGAKKVLTLEAYQKTLGVDKLDLAVDFGWFWFFTKPFFFALHYLGLFLGNMGLAIIVLTIVIRSAVFPLTSISYRSFAKMKVVTPQIALLREQFGDDKEKLQAEIVKLYQKEGVNPLSGCLPIVIQIPIFFAFYKILFTTIEIRHAPFFGWIQDLSEKDPTSVFNLFGLIPYHVPEILMIGAWPCMMLVTTIMQKYLNPPPQDKMQRDMMRIFPFFITFIMAKFASGLVIYWTFSAALSILQQAYIMRSLGVPVYFFNKDKYKADIDKKATDGPDVHPLIEMVEDEAEKALLGLTDDSENNSTDDTPSSKPIKPPKPKKKKK